MVDTLVDLWGRAQYVSNNAEQPSGKLAGGCLRAESSFPEGQARRNPNS
jgi:hypothetical protein